MEGDMQSMQSAQLLTVVLHSNQAYGLKGHHLVKL